MRARLLVNPASGRGRGARHLAGLERLARAAGVEVEASASADDLVARARRARDEGIERLLVGGGDGTWHWAAQGLAGGDTALAPVPLGTGNDLARELGHPLEPEKAFATGLTGPPSRIDLGRVGGRHFCGVAGVGFDAAAAEFARSRVKRLRGPAVYVYAALATLVTYRPPRFVLRGDCGELEGEIFFVAFANGSHYGGGMRIAPEADPRDGLLDIVLVRRAPKLSLLRILPAIYRGAHVRHPAVEIRRGARLELTVEPEQPINADGESAGSTGGRPLEIGLTPAGLAVVGAGKVH